jgi:hypothetical protein
LERRARERYDTLDCLDAELNWYQGQYNALDALVEALRTPDRWLVYRAEALRDHPPELDAQAAEDVPAVERVKAALVDRDEALHKVREDLRGCAPWRLSGRARWPLFVPSFSRTVRLSRERGPGRIRPRRWPRRPRS